jgi:hypothetical protein
VMSPACYNFADRLMCTKPVGWETGNMAPQSQVLPHFPGITVALTLSLMVNLVIVAVTRAGRGWLGI